MRVNNSLYKRCLIRMILCINIRINPRYINVFVRLFFSMYVISNEILPFGKHDEILFSKLSSYMYKKLINIVVEP